MSESFDPALESDWEASTRRCHACATRGRHLDGLGDIERHGLFVTTHRIHH